MKYLVPAVLITALALSTEAHSQEAGVRKPGIYAGLDVGRTTVELRSGPGVIEGGQNKLKAISAALNVGYQWSSGVILEARLRTTVDFLGNFFGIDSESHSESQYLIGYRYFVNERFAVVPMIGYSDWEIDEVSSGLFSRSGPSRIERESGNGTIFRFGLERLVGNSQSAFTLYTSYSNNNENRAMDTSLGFKLYF
jgi:hypothetical protein